MSHSGARDLAATLGYPDFQKFENVIDKARDAFRHNKEDPSHHIARTGEMVSLGSGARRSVTDYYLSRAACFLIAMSAESSKVEVATAHGYFAVQTRRIELVDQANKANKDQARIDGREDLTAATKRVQEIAHDLGVENFALFHDARWRGMYGKSMRQVASDKAVPEGEHIFSYSGELELSRTLFR